MAELIISNLERKEKLMTPNLYYYTVTIHFFEWRIWIEVWPSGWSTFNHWPDRWQISYMIQFFCQTLVRNGFFFYVQAGTKSFDLHKISNLPFSTFISCGIHILNFLNKPIDFKMTTNTFVATIVWWGFSYSASFLIKFCHCWMLTVIHGICFSRSYPLTKKL